MFEYFARTKKIAPQSADEIIFLERRSWIWNGIHFGIVLAVILLCAGLTGMLDVERIADGVPAIGTLFTEMFPPNFVEAQNWVWPMIDTIAMSIAGTALSIVFSLPLGILAARNTTPNSTVYRIARGILNIFRSIPELIMGIVFVAAVGFGALPGVLALGLHSIGMVGKFFSEAIEHAHEAPVEAARAAGASQIQVIAHGIMPQVIPQFADVIMYRWEYNFRASTVMGMVGAGGIGLELIASLRLMQYSDVFAILISILVMVTIVDALSAILRKRFK
ncbi:MAG: Phosphate-import permease protein PhnE [Alphaproteobacteria bacterium MarineAlpha4_Bin2]|nr:MAG: Phosphate-import permease protein PhnE [Alphaproteobacteria bacterium MarineAlpha4_Bin2]|tara:strand:- start:109 stop:939 length:831 start_codon:yes stop_codon:yes gene_type:complete